MKGIFKNKWFWIILVAVVILIVVLIYLKKKKKPSDGGGGGIKEGDKCHIPTLLDSISGILGGIGVGVSGSLSLDGVIKNGICVKAGGSKPAEACTGDKPYPTYDLWGNFKGCSDKA